MRAILGRKNTSTTIQLSLEVAKH